MHHPATVALSLLAASLFVAGGASAYQLRKTAAGTQVRWERETITVVADPSLTRLGPDAIDAAALAFAAWSTVPGTTGPNVVLVEGTADEVGYREGAENRNTLRYEPEGYGAAGGALAITVLTFDGAGKIVDADIVLNGGGSHGFAVLPEAGPKDDRPEAGEGGPYDVEDVLTHEAGHFFGLAHNDADVDATMYFATARGETKKRDLSPDDEAGFRAIYAGSRTFTAACAVGEGPAASSPGALGATLLTAAVLAAARQRRRRVIVEST